VTPPLVDDLASEAARIVRRHVRPCGIRQLWTDGDRILFRLEDGREGDVEIAINWNVVAGFVTAADEEDGARPL
jgi:hypothetical protein